MFAKIYAYCMFCMVYFDGKCNTIGQCCQMNRFIWSFSPNPENIYRFKVNNKITRERCDMFKVNNKDIKTYWDLFCWLWTYFKTPASVSSATIVEQVNVSWERTVHSKKKCQAMVEISQTRVLNLTKL